MLLTFSMLCQYISSLLLPWSLTHNCPTSQIILLLPSSFRFLFCSVRRSTAGPQRQTISRAGRTGTYAKATPKLATPLPPPPASATVLALTAALWSSVLWNACPIRGPVAPMMRLVSCTKWRRTLYTHTRETRLVCECTMCGPQEQLAVVWSLIRICTHSR